MVKNCVIQIIRTIELRFWFTNATGESKECEYHAKFAGCSHARLMKRIQESPCLRIFFSSQPDGTLNVSRLV